MIPTKITPILPLALATLSLLASSSGAEPMRLVVHYDGIIECRREVGTLEISDVTDAGGRTSFRDQGVVLEGDVRHPRTGDEGHVDLTCRYRWRDRFVQEVERVGSSGVEDADLEDRLSEVGPFLAILPEALAGTDPVEGRYLVKRLDRDAADFYHLRRTETPSGVEIELVSHSDGRPLARLAYTETPDSHDLEFMSVSVRDGSSETVVLEGHRIHDAAPDTIVD